MAFNLCVDIGNTNTKLGLFEKNDLVQVVKLKNEDLTVNSQIFDDYDIQSTIVSSVNDAVLDQLNLNQYPSLIHLGPSTQLPFQLEYETPETLGKDRIAVIAAAHQLFPKRNCLVMDFGTCITYDILTSDAHYLGGSISPGIQLRLRAMHNQTDKLPMIFWDQSLLPETIGKSTITSMLSGVVNGAVKEMKGFVKEYEEKYHDLQILITGGDANFFEKALKNGIFADQNLVLIGLHEILKYNGG